MASGGYDGSITMSTKIDESGFNNGLKKITSAIEGAFLKFAMPMAKFAATAGNLIKGVIQMFRDLAIGIVAAVLLFDRIWKGFTSAIAPTSAYGDMVRSLDQAFADLGGAFDAAFGALLTAAMPAIMTVIGWVVQLLNFLTQVIAALSGQNTYMQYVAGSAKSAADSTGKMAKAAKGALASFDQINVLQQKNDTAAPASGFGSGTAQFKSVPIDPAILAFFKDPWGSIWTWIKDTAASAWAFIVAQAGPAWDTLKAIAVDTWQGVVALFGLAGNWFQTQVIAPIVGLWQELFFLIGYGAGVLWANIISIWNAAPAWFNTITEAIKAWFTEAFYNIGAQAGQTWTNVVNFWNGAGAWFQRTVTEPVKKFFDDIFYNIGLWAGQTWTKVVNAWNGAPAWFQKTITDPISNWFNTAFYNIGDWAGKAWTTIIKVWEGAPAWFTTNITDKISSIFHDALGGSDGKGGIAGLFGGLWNTVTSVAKEALNGIIGLLNGLISRIVTGINGIVGAANKAGSIVPGWTTIPSVTGVTIPALATGAVIPPNAKFAAILGDQRNGNSLEAPEALIRKIVREETQGLGSGNITVTFGGSMGELVRLLKPQIDRENSRVGMSLLSGGQV